VRGKSESVRQQVNVSLGARIINNITKNIILTHSKSLKYVKKSYYFPLFTIILILTQR